jgi:hypothetical protein
MSRQALQGAIQEDNNWLKQWMKDGRVLNQQELIELMLKFDQYLVPDSTLE